MLHGGGVTVWSVSSMRKLWIISILSTNFISTGPSRGVEPRVEKLHTVTNRVCMMETQLVDPGASALLTQMMSDVSCTLIG